MVQRGYQTLYEPTGGGSNVQYTHSGSFSQIAHRTVGRDVDAIRTTLCRGYARPAVAASGAPGGAGYLGQPNTSGYRHGSKYITAGSRCVAYS